MTIKTSRPWWIKRVRHFNSRGRCVVFKVRWWMRPFKPDVSTPGPYWERPNVKRGRWYR